MPEDNKTNDKKGEGEEKVEKKDEPVPVKEMKSIVLTAYGGIKCVKVQQKPEPSAKEGEVLVRVKACGLNFSDLVVRQGAVENLPKTPFIMGSEFSGVVEAIGEGVTKFKVGDRVLGVVESEAWAELVTIKVDHLFKIPTDMTFHDAAAIFINYVTAYILLFEIGNLRKDQSVLAHSIGGGVGHAICQLARTVEGVQIFGTASANKHESIKDNLNHLFDHSSDYGSEIKKISPDGIDLVLDCLCGENTNKGISLLKPLGKYVLYGSASIITGETKSIFSRAKSWWQVDKISPTKLYEENRTVSGFNLRNMLLRQNCKDCIEDITEKLFKMNKAKTIKPQIDSTWAFEDVGLAMQKMHDRKNIGKIILDPSLTPKEPEPEVKEEKKEENKENKDAKDETKE